MAYFLKKTKQQNRIYLAIYESFYSPEVNGTKHRCFKSLGNIETIKANGIADPISFYSDEVKKLNEQRKAEQANRKFNQKLISGVRQLKIHKSSKSGLVAAFFVSSP